MWYVSRKDSIMVSGTLKSQHPKSHVGCHEPKQWWQGIPSRENPTQPSWSAGTDQECSAALVCAQGMGQ